MSEKEVSKNIIIGSVCILVAQFLFATNDSLVKYSVNDQQMTTSQLLFGRFLVQLIIGAIWWQVMVCKRPQSNRDQLLEVTSVNNAVIINDSRWYGDGKDVPILWIRGFAYSFQVMFAYYAYVRLPVGDAICIYYQCAVWIAFIAFVWLKEPLPKWFILVPTIILTSIGIVCIAQPTFLLKLCGSPSDSSSLNVDGLIALFAAMFCWAICCVLIRKAKNAYYIQMDLVSSAAMLCFTLPLVMLLNFSVWQSAIVGSFMEWKFDLFAVTMMMCVGIIGFAALTLSVIGYQYGDATKVSWMELIMPLFMFMYQATWFDDSPDEFEISGAAMMMFGSMLPVAWEFRVYCNINEYMYTQVANDDTTDIESI